MSKDNFIITTNIETIPNSYVGGLDVTISRKLTPEHQYIASKIIKLIAKFNRGEHMKEIRKAFEEFEDE